MDGNKRNFIMHINMGMHIAAYYNEEGIRENYKLGCRGAE